MQIEKTFHHEEATFVGELTVEEEFEFGAQLARGHALYVVLLGVRFNELGGKLGIKSEGVGQWLATAANRELHPELLEPLRV